MFLWESSLKQKSSAILQIGPVPPLIHCFAAPHSKPQCWTRSQIPRSLLNYNCLVQCHVQYCPAIDLTPLLADLELRVRFSRGTRLKLILLGSKYHRQTQNFDSPLVKFYSESAFVTFLIVVHCDIMNCFQKPSTTYDDKLEI